MVELERPTPGRVNEGTVWHRRTYARACEVCGGVTTDAVPPGEHGRRWLNGVLVNCVGREVS